MRDISNIPEIKRLINVYKRHVTATEVKAFEVDEEEINIIFKERFGFENEFDNGVVVFICYLSDVYKDGTITCVFNEKGFHNATLIEPNSKTELSFLQIVHKFSCTTMNLAKFL